MEKINIKTSRRVEMVDITDKVQAVVAKGMVKSGVCFLFCPHTTAGLTINENADPSSILGAFFKEPLLSSKNRL